jgi:hypothetical protein
MTWRFDPSAERARLAVLTDGRWAVRREVLASATAGKARSTANLAIGALLAGLPQVADEVARLSLASPDALKVNAARYSDANYAEYRRLYDQAGGWAAHALLRWIVEGVLPRDELALTLTHLDAALEAFRRYSTARMDTVDLDGYLRTAVLAQQDGRALALFRAHDRDGDAPLVPEKARSERKVAALIADYRAAGRAPDAALESAVDKLIRRMLPPWLSGGRPADLAEWLIVREDLHERQRPPAQVVQDALDFMPGVVRP